MKQELYESAQSLVAKTLKMRLTLERIGPEHPPARGFEDHLVPAIGLTMRLDMDEVLDRSYAQNEVDESCFAFVRSHVRPGTAFVDIGANQGIYSCLVLHEFPDVTVVSIEPDPYSVGKLRANVALNGLDESRLALFDVAVSDRVETRELMLNVAGNRAGSSLVVDQRQWTHRDENVTVSVPCRPLIDLLDEAGVSRVSVVKIDIEGFEFPVLRAYLEAAPRERWPEALVVEAFGHCIPLVGGSTVELLIRAGYDLVDHDNYNYFFVLPAE